MELGQRIRHIRETKGITQAKLADSIHVSASLMNRIEKGSSTPSLEHICNIAVALNVSVQDILCDFFSYPEDTLTTAEKIKISVEKFSPEIQQILLETIDFLASRLK